MKKERYYIVAGLGLAFLLLTGCGNRSRKTGQTAPPVFPRVEMPALITEPQAIADYMAQHYWDKFDFTDTLFRAYPDVLEQAFVDYIVILPYASGNLGPQSVAKLMTRAQADTAMYRLLTEKSEHYLWDPNSPYRDEELYIPVLENIVANPATDAATLARSQYRLETALKNRPGMTATDFDYTLASGQTRKMAQVRSEYLLLFFNNPGCNACAEIIAAAGNSPIFKRLQEERKNGVPRLTVLALYPDEDLEAWREYLPQMPPHWINGYDRGTVIKNENSYDLKAIPTLYLLDKDKKVLLKDADIGKIELYLQQNAL